MGGSTVPNVITGFHAPTVSWPVINTIMMEPTESESRVELDRYCDALICKCTIFAIIIIVIDILLLAIRKEITEIEDGEFNQQNNVFKVCCWYNSTFP